MHQGHAGGRRALFADPVLLGLVALCLAIVPWFTVGPGGTVSSWVLQTAIDVVDCVLAVRLARLTAGNRHARRFWRTVVAGTALCATGDLYQTVKVIAGPPDQGTSVVQTAFVVLGMVAVVVVMLCHPLGGTGRQRLRLWLDAATVLTGVAVFLWYFSLADVISTGDRAQRIAAAVASAVMLLIVFAVLKLVLSGTAPFTRSAGILGSVGVAGTAVGASAASSLTGSTDPGLMTVGQLLPCVLVAVSFRLQEVQERRRPAGTAAPVRRRSSRLPYVAVIASQVLLVTTLPRLGADLRLWGVAVGVVLSTALVLGRQVAAFTDNERLLAELDRNMVEMRALHEKLHHQATHDGLTGLANRTLLEQRLAELPGDEPVNLLLVDLDGFKPVNDRYGHHAGDQVLIAVAGRLAAATGGTGLAARLGGDEFAVLLPRAGAERAGAERAGAERAGAERAGVGRAGTDAPVPDGAAVAGVDAAALAGLIAAAVAEPIPVAGGTVMVGASVGIATGPPHDADRILREADAAMYRTKADRKAALVGSTAAR